MRRESENIQQEAGIIEIYPVLLSAIGFLNFMLYHKTAYKWPAADMFPFFSRMQDTSFVLNDFFTNASTVPNARFVFGYFVIGLGNLFHMDWYTAVFLVKTLLILLTPAAWFLALSGLVKRYVPQQSFRLAQLMIAISIVLIMADRVNSLVSVAWWPPYLIESMSSSVSLIFGLAGMIFCEYKSTAKITAGVLLFAASTLFHPAIGIFCVAFYLLGILYFVRTEIKKMAWVAVAGLAIPAVVVTVLFTPAHSLDTASFISIYILNNHPFHYHLKDFGSSYPLFNWKISFVIVTAALVVPLLFFIYKKRWPLVSLAAVFLFTYAGAVAAQYIFVDILPVKVVAVIGPVRFTQFGYWMAVLLWVSMLSGLLPFLPVFGKSGSSWGYIPIRQPMLKAVLYIFIFGIVTGIGVSFRDDPFSTAYAKDKPLYDFLKTTSPASVFVVYKSEHTINIPLVARRAIFTGNGFPFSESSMTAFNERTSLVYGDYVSLGKEKFRWVDEKIASFYRKLTPGDFVKVSEKFPLDYVIIEKDYAESFKDFRPVFEDTAEKVYAIAELKK